ncbi:hypothetical protein PR048_028553 [Dryococelus australis]|uniref:Uncharacterized protein n=1 Tax=Dryococelus australis TaxID=614101 RepID=A0ABQ9GDJ3_9NEOP|nr:hypothetical protein PR048_028553 [Dryococelus australis]
MLKRLLEMQAALSAEMASPKNTSDVQMLAPQEWRHMSGLVEILQPLADAREELSGDSCPTLSMVIPILHCLESHLTRCIQHKTEGIMFARNFLKALKSKFGIYKEDSDYLL